MLVPSYPILFTCIKIQYLSYKYLINSIRLNQVRFTENLIMSSCVKPLMQRKETPLVLLHGFDRFSEYTISKVSLIHFAQIDHEFHTFLLFSSCLEWRYAYPLLEESGFETWAIDILGWGFSDLEKLPPCDVVSKRDHFYQFWKSYIKRPMILVGPSLGSAIAIDFAVNYPEAVKKLVLIGASVYAKGTGNLATLPRTVAYAGVNLLKSIPLRFYVNYFAATTNKPFSTTLDWTNVGRLHCLMPWWDDATVDFMTSGGYSVASIIGKVKQKTLIIWGENDRIISNKLAVQLHCELPDAIIRQIPNCGHLPHVERPDFVVNLIVEFVQSPRDTKKLSLCRSQV
ncbi:putative 2-hydroxy-6-oxonona-2,4-dienedioate hydrolase [Lupinus albus]|uniref:Putative 2-hydroxy-6-oxonona-2,4-dienedioate hydrolase n=1 Tax=Lupinus albus TaxID=3870 RepID=A0A6A4NTS5_LUPAL|nr:putative 2-hydroxy-6-oxonona-2,4-dienedioate hydrolase [Lupinus albus]